MRGPQPPVRAPAAGMPAAQAATAPAAEEKEDVSDLWLVLSAIPRPHRNVPLPRNLPGTKESVGEVPIWPLTQGELLDSNAAADKYVKSLFNDPQKKDEIALGYNHSFANELAVQHLWRACRNPVDLKRSAFPSPKAMRLQFTGDEIGVLYNHYLTVQSEIGPITSSMSDEEYETWVRKIAESGNADPFDGLVWELQRTLVVSMASQLASYWTATSSPGQALDGSTSPTSEERSNDSALSSEADGEPAS